MRGPVTVRAVCCQVRIAAAASASAGTTPAATEPLALDSDSESDADCVTVVSAFKFHHPNYRFQLVDSGNLVLPLSF